MANTNAPQKTINATTNSGVDNSNAAVLATVTVPEPAPIYQDDDDYTEFTGDYDRRVYRDNQKDIFTVEFTDLKGKKGTFHFDLLPAIENRGGGNTRSGDVPEAKAGILRMLETRHKNIVVPGATPVVQSIGIKSALVNLVGCFTGEEGNSATSKTKRDVLILENGDQTPTSENAYVKATAFHNEVVLPMTPVTVTVQASKGSDGVIKMVYTGVIIKFKDFAVRSNRNYYTIDLLVTSYAAHQVSTVAPKSDVDKALENASDEDKAAIKAAQDKVNADTKKLEEARETHAAAPTAKTDDGNPVDTSAAAQAVKDANDALAVSKSELDAAVKKANENKKPKSF
jgi:hypothetical protein